MATAATVERLGYTVREAAEAIRVSPGTVRNLIWEGTLPASRIRARVMISREALEKLLDQFRPGTLELKLCEMLHPDPSSAISPLHRRRYGKLPSSYSTLA